MMKYSTAFSECSAGFRARAAAFGIDLGLAALVMSTARWVAGYWGVYIAGEASTLVFLMVYSTVLIGRKGATFGKRLCGLTVRSRSGAAVGWRQAVLRESVGKVLSGLALGLGFLRVGLDREKRGWHDLLAGTRVSQDRTRTPYVRWALAIEMVVVGVWLLQPTARTLGAWRFGARLPAIDRIPQRDPARLVEVTSLETDRLEAFQDWMSKHGKNPKQYVIGIASSHELTLIGECHNVRENLDFLKRLIPDLYRQAGVRCLALEFCLADDNALLERLVTGSEYDEELALEIARRAPWAAWGWSEYWEVLRTVWDLNRHLLPDQPPLRVVGLSCPWDGPSLALVKSGPFCERLRLWRVLPELPVITLLPDRVYARNAAKETLDKGQKGVVWVGAAHTPIHSTGVPRMGALLFRKYGERVYPIRLHENQAGRTVIGGFIEEVMKERRDQPVGFTVQGSPFAVLRDFTSGDWNSMFPYRQASACFEDVACGYVYLGPASQQTRCQWGEGYISRRMFARNRPFYEGACGRRLTNAEEANRVGCEGGFKF